MKKVIIDSENKNSRLDLLVGAHLTSLSRSYIAKLIEQGKILVDGNQEKAGYKLRENNVVTIDFDERDLDTIPDIELPIMFEDDNVIVIDKPTGVISHSRGRYWDEPSVASFIRQKLKGMDGERAGIVHRLDRATSGVMVCAKNQETLKFLQMQFSKRQVYKTYVAVCEGKFDAPNATIDAPITRNPKKPTTFKVNKNGKPAQTQYKVLNEDSGNSLVELKPLTGRTHQLRVHLEYVNHPILGDAFYGKEDSAPRLMLHAKSLEITLPGGERKTFIAPLPKEFKNYE